MTVLGYFVEKKIDISMSQNMALREIITIITRRIEGKLGRNEVVERKEQGIREYARDDDKKKIIIFNLFSLLWKKRSVKENFYLLR